MRATRCSAAVVWAGLGWAGLAGLAVVTAACSPQAPTKVAATSAVPLKGGGTLHLLFQGPVEVWDPQRQHIGADMAFAGRVFSRTLTAWAPATKQDSVPELAPDLATDTGRVDVGGKRWTFTLRNGARWQDGKAVTCADVKYGISRTYATAQITGGLTYALDFLDVPHKEDGSSTYVGPYDKTGESGTSGKSGKSGGAAFDKAVTCSGRTLQFKLARAVPDFNQVVALSAFAPVRSDKDRGAKSATEIFSNGPYMLKGPWQVGKGATFVRNPQWQASTDPIRKARPAELVYSEGIPVETVFARIMANAGSDAFAVTADSAPQVLQNDILSDPAVMARSSNPRGPFVDYLLPNVSRPTMAKLGVRKALAVATSRQAYLTALGGASAADATHSMINKSLPAYRDFNPLKVPPRGDVPRARALLKASGLSLPVKITVAYRKGLPADNAMAGLRQGWEEAGFSVTLVGIEKDYFTNIAEVKNSRNYDVMWAVGSAVWPSGSSVIPSLFDSRLNLSPSSSGQDYGRFASARFSAKIDATAKIPEASKREKAWGDLDEELAENVAAIALTNSRSVFVRGAKVTDYIDNPALFGTVDLATVSVQ